MNFKFDIKRFFPSKNTSDADVINASPVGTKSKLKSIAVLAKANLLLFTLALISILAFGAALYFSNELQNKNNKEAQIFGEKLVALSKLEQTQVTIRIPGNDDINEKVLVTERLVDAVKAKMPSEASNQGNSIQSKAVDFNQGIHKPVTNLRKNTKTGGKFAYELLYEELVKKYDELLTQCHLGSSQSDEDKSASPPSEEDVLVNLQRLKLRYIQTELGKNFDYKMTPSEQSELMSKLTQRRLGEYSIASEKYSFYVNASSIGAPAKGKQADGIEKIWNLTESGNNSDLLKMWDEQMKYWITQDIIDACSKVNKSGPLAKNPIKRIMQIQFLGRVTGGESAGEKPAEEAPPEPPPSADPSADPNADPNDGTAVEAAAAPAEMGIPIDPNGEIVFSNYADSLKGWSSNQLYDIYRSKVTMVVETTKIPLVTNALVKQNFITITDVQMLPTDPFRDIQDGFFYGEGPLSTIKFTLESVWLREWTGKLMPDEVRKKFGTTGLLPVSSQE